MFRFDLLRFIDIWDTPPLAHSAQFPPTHTHTRVCFVFRFLEHGMVQTKKASGKSIKMHLNVCPNATPYLVDILYMNAAL